MADHSHYKPEFCEIVKTYLKNCSNENQKLPKRIDVALLLGVDKNTLLNWERIEGNENFASIMREVDGYQESYLIDASFYGGKEVNPNVGTFLLSANHGYAPKEKKELTGAGGSPLTFSIEGVSGKKENPIT